MNKLHIRSLAYGEQFEEFGIYMEERLTGNLYVYYAPDKTTVTIDGSAYLQAQDSRHEFLHECSEELFPELLNRGIQEVESKHITLYQNQQSHQEEIPEPSFDYGRPNSW
jgi:hypothetical protein